MKNIVIFASGAGSNANEIIRYFHAGNLARVVGVFCNKPGAGVFDVARSHGVPAEIITKTDLQTGSALDKVKACNPDLIVLAGFLLMFPENIIREFPDRVINIHPALLPKFGGKGMYGMNVHRAVADCGETQTGITIHYVDEHYDSGDIIAQFPVAVDPSDTCDDISEKVRRLEHEHFPKVIEKLLK